MALDLNGLEQIANGFRINSAETKTFVGCTTFYLGV